MKRLEMKDWEILHWALDIKQLEEIQEKGTLTLDKQGAIDTLKRSLKLGAEVRKQMEVNLQNLTEKEREMVQQIITNGIERDKDEAELLERLEKDTEDYLIGFMKGDRG